MRSITIMSETLSELANIALKQGTTILERELPNIRKIAQDDSKSFSEKAKTIAKSVGKYHPLLSSAGKGNNIKRAVNEFTRLGLPPAARRLLMHEASTATQKILAKLGDGVVKSTRSGRRFTRVNNGPRVVRNDNSKFTFNRESTLAAMRSRALRPQLPFDQAGARLLGNSFHSPF